jgi:hypothetical protein
MFKRVEKRRRKKEEEEELGLDDDMKEVLGVQDTDSDESDSDSEESDTGIEKAGESDANEEENVDGESSDGKDIELSVEDALEDPVYLVSLELDTKACIVCPGKVLKHPKMIEVHKASGVCIFQKLSIFISLMKSLYRLIEDVLHDLRNWQVMQTQGIELCISFRRMAPQRQMTKQVDAARNGRVSSSPNKLTLFEHLILTESQTCSDQSQTRTHQTEESYGESQTKGKGS